MNSHGSAAPALAELSDVGQRARRRIAYRLLPFVFLIYIVNYIDRVNVSFANLRMSADLGFSDRVYGLGVGMFYLTYVLFEIPGAIIEATRDRIAFLAEQLSFKPPDAKAIAAIPALVQPPWPRPPQ